MIAVFLAMSGSLLLMAQRTTEKRQSLLDNDRVTVREVLIEPGIDYAPHTHDLPHVGIIIKGGTLQFTEKGKTDTVTFQDGSVGWREAGVTHSIRNTGRAKVRVIEVELKGR